VQRALVPAPHRPTSGAPVEVTRAALGVRPGEYLLVCVARLAPQKGLGLLLDTVAGLVADPALTGRVRAVLAGDGPLDAELAAGAADRHLPLTLLGRRDDVPDLLAAADVVVVPSVWEGQPLIVQEALRAGAAIVATEVGGTAEVTGDAAVLVPSERRDTPERAAGAMAAAISELLTDGAARTTLRERARSRAAQLPTDEDAGRQVLAVYDPEPNGWSPVPPGGRGVAAGRDADNLKARGATDS
jgi:glycosyltransferase involved in cell wall biosynthesis